MPGSCPIKSKVIELAAHPDLALAVEQLSKVYRTGWRLRGIPNAMGESVLDHSIKVVRAALLYPDPDKKLNRFRMVLMAFVHDFAEYKVPDFTPHDKISRDEKYKLERDAMLELVQGAGEEGKLVLSLWEEFEAKVTAESRIVTQMDKLDAALQAFEYEKLGFEVSEFYPYALAKLSDPLLISVLRDLPSLSKSTNAYEFYFHRLQSQTLSGNVKPILVPR